MIFASFNKFLLDLYYTSGANSPNPLLLWIYYKYLRSPLVVKWLFGMNVLSAKELSVYFDRDNLPVYFNSGTLLLKMALKEKLSQLKEAKLLEIGSGAFAILSGCLSLRYQKIVIDSVDVDMACVESAKKHIQLNKVNVCAFYSDIFSNVPVSQYDLIFWNLPGTDKDEEVLLPRLFKSAPNFMNDSSQLAIIYNTRVLPRESVLNILSRYQHLQVHEIKTWWNIQEVLFISKKLA